MLYVVFVIDWMYELVYVVFYMWIKVFKVMYLYSNYVNDLVYLKMVSFNFNYVYVFNNLD